MMDRRIFIQGAALVAHGTGYCEPLLAIMDHAIKSSSPCGYTLAPEQKRPQIPHWSKFVDGTAVRDNDSQAVIRMTPIVACSVAIIDNAFSNWSQPGAGVELRLQQYEVSR